MPAEPNLVAGGKARYLITSAQPVPQQTPQTGLLMKPSCRPLPPHKGHFLGGGITRTLPFPLHPGQLVLPNIPRCFPVPPQRAQLTDTAAASTGSAGATGFPQ